jgi:hypothetical protein
VAAPAGVQFRALSRLFASKLGLADSGADTPTLYG